MRKVKYFAFSPSTVLGLATEIHLLRLICHVPLLYVCEVLKIRLICFFLFKELAFFYYFLWSIFNNRNLSRLENIYVRILQIIREIRVFGQVVIGQAKQYLKKTVCNPSVYCII